MTPAFLRGLAQLDYPDPTMVTRRAAIAILASLALSSTAGQISCWAMHLIAAELQGQRAGQGLLIWHVDGSIALPGAAEAPQIIQTALQCFVANDFSAMASILPHYVDLADGVPSAIGRVTRIDLIIRTLLCVSGATAPTGRAPGSTAEKAVRKGKGKGKGRK